MLNRARRRVARQGFAHVELLEQDAARMSFRNDSFDSVYAPYVMSVVVDPIRVAREMRRVCRPGGRIVILNHFRSTNPLLSRLERATSPLTVHVGFRLDLSLTELLRQAAPMARVGREGELPADVVARDVYQALRAIAAVFGQPPPALYAGNLTPALALSQQPRAVLNSNACQRGKHHQR